MTELTSPALSGHVHAYGYGDRGYDRNNDVGLDDLILSSQIHTGALNGIRETSESARDVIDAVRDSITATNQIGNINLQSTERNGGESRQTTERAAGSIRDRIAEMAAENSRDVHRVVEELCNVKLEAAKQHGAMQLEMTKQHCDLAAKLAECCCELKQENAETRRLLQAQALDECRRREQDLQNEVNLLKIVGAQNS